jgi:hypothetical protein
MNAKANQQEATAERNQAAAEAAARALESAQTGLEDDVDDSEETVTLTSVIVMIEFDVMSKPTSRVFDYEVPVLFELHGEDKVSVVEASAQEVEVPVAEIHEMYDQLTRKYGKKGADAVRIVYPRVSDLADEIGVEMRKTRVVGSKYTQDTQQSEQRDHSQTAAAKPTTRVVQRPKTVTTASGQQARGRAATKAARSSSKAKR